MTSLVERLRGWTYWKCSDGHEEGFDSTPFEAADTIEAMQRALEDIDAMPYYTAPVNPEHVGGLLARYNKALDIANAVLNWKPS